jgi:hypothetical protein
VNGKYRTRTPYEIRRKAEQSAEAAKRGTESGTVAKGSGVVDAIAAVMRLPLSNEDKAETAT